MRGGLLLLAVVVAALVGSAASGAPASKGACRLLHADDLRTAFREPGGPIYSRPDPPQPIRQIPGQRRFHGTEQSCTFFGDGGAAQLDILLSVLPTRAEAARYYRQSTGRFCAKRDRLAFGPIGCRTSGTAGHIVASSSRFQVELDGSVHDRSAMSLQTLEQLAKYVFEDAPRYY